MTATEQPQNDGAEATCPGSCSFIAMLVAAVQVLQDRQAETRIEKAVGEVPPASHAGARPGACVCASPGFHRPQMDLTPQLYARAT